jgi:hypothetical protein
MQPRRPQARAMQHEQKRAFYLHQATQSLLATKVRRAEKNRKTLFPAKQFLTASVELW